MDVAMLWGRGTEEEDVGMLIQLLLSLNEQILLDYHGF